MLKTFTFIFRWRDGNPSSWPVEAPNLLQAVRGVFERTNLDAHGGLVALTVLNALGGRGRPQHLHFAVTPLVMVDPRCDEVFLPQGWAIQRPMPRAFWRREGNAWAKAAEVARG